MAEILMEVIVHCMEEGTFLAVEAASVQPDETVGPVESTNEVGAPTEGKEPVVEKVSGRTNGC
jgi:hypothetical protein